MKIRNYLLSCLLVSSNLMLAQSLNNDTIQEHELKEIVVEAQMQRTSATTSTYIPSARQKNSASDAVSLLSQMAIPQLEVNPSTLTVNTISGQAVSIFIDYVAATSQDLQGMQPKDVKRVEFLLNPKDPRFKGAPYVVLFIMHKYEWGGYTKFNVNKTFVVNRTNGSIYSKFAYKSMIFDMYADEMYLADRHSGMKSKEIFHFTDLYGEGARMVERISDPEGALYRSNSNNVTFRALYNADKVQVSNMLSFNNTVTPHNDYESNTYYKNDFLKSSRTFNSSSSHNIGLNYDFATYIFFSRNLSLNIQASYQYSHNKSKALYRDEDLRIINNAVENAHYTYVMPTLLWSPDQHNSIMPFINAIYSGNNIQYTGNSPSYQSYDIWAGMGGIKYTYSQRNWSAGTNVGWVYVHSNLTGLKINNDYPTGNIFATYSLSNRHQFELRYAFGKEEPAIYQKSPNMLQQDELMWYAGTPELDNYWMHRIDLQYVWLPNNIWQIAADSYYFTERNRIITNYTPSGPEGTMLRKYVNDGNFHQVVVGLSGTAKFLNGKLIAKVRPQYWHRNTTGEYRVNINEVTCTAQLTWYFGNFYLFGWYGTPSTYVGANGISKVKSPSSYQIQFSWGKGPWRFTATAYNFLRSSWETTKESLEGKYYSYDRSTYGTTDHMSFKLTASYTIGYGKKVRMGSEVSGAGTSKSAILK